MNRMEREKKRIEAEDLYRSLITDLKILYMRAEYKKEKTNEERYKNAYQKLELIQERRHLTEIGKEGKHKETYLTTLKMIQETYKKNDARENTIDRIIDNIEQICDTYDINNKDVKDEKIENIEVGR